MNSYHSKEPLLDKLINWLKYIRKRIDTRDEFRDLYYEIWELEKESDVKDLLYKNIVYRLKKLEAPSDIKKEIDNIINLKYPLKTDISDDIKGLTPLQKYEVVKNKFVLYAVEKKDK